MCVRRVLAILSLSVFSFLTPSLFAEEFILKVTDPQGAAVSRAQVSLYRGAVPVEVQHTSANGVATFREVNPGNYTVRVLAAGFAAENSTIAVPAAGEAVVRLRVAGPAENVEVTASRLPLAGEETVLSVNSLDQDQLAAMQPVDAGQALRFLPGTVVNGAGRRGGMASLFVRGGDSRYNKVIVDGVVVNDPGGTIDFGVVPMQELERLEFVRGADSALYGSDAMTGVVQMFSRNGKTRLPEFRFGADGGTFATAHGYASLAGARGPLDFNLFADQFNTEGQGVNDAYSNSSQGGNVGVALSPRAFLRLRSRHSNSRTGVPSFWQFNGQPLLDPDTDQYARQNNFLGSAELSWTLPNRWQHTLTGFEYNHRRTNVNQFMDPGRVSPLWGNIDWPFDSRAYFNRAGLDYRGEYLERTWARSTFGYHFEVENGWFGAASSLNHGLRRNHAVFGEQVIIWQRLSFITGVRLEHNETFGNRVIPRVAASVLVLRGGQFFSGTRLRLAYGQSIKEPRFEETFVSDPFTVPNPDLKAEENRSWETGFEQSFAAGKYSARATYFNNQFRNLVAYSTDPDTFISQYVNVDRTMSHGAEVEFHGRPLSRLSLAAAYTYASTQILVASSPFDPLLETGRPLLRRPKHSGNVLATWTAKHWGANLGATFVGRRPDSDFVGLLPPVTYVAGYGRIDVGVWHALTSRVTAYVNVENITNRHYEEAAGYPALRANFRAGMRFRLGGE